MSITINIEPSEEAELKRQAEAAGLTVEQFARQFLEQWAALVRRHHPPN